MWCSVARKPQIGEVPFGWCLTGNHDRCEKQVMSQGKLKQCVCTCDNHGVNWRPSPPPSDLLLEMIAKWGSGSK